MIVVVVVVMVVVIMVGGGGDVLDRGGVDGVLALVVIVLALVVIFLVVAAFVVDRGSVELQEDHLSGACRGIPVSSAVCQATGDLGLDTMKIGRSWFGWGCSWWCNQGCSR